MFALHFWLVFCVQLWPYDVVHGSTQQDFLTEARPVLSVNQYSLHFLLAQSYLTTGEIDKAIDHFLKAAGGVSKLCMYIMYILCRCILCM